MKTTERTLLVLGNKNAGKTTLIHRFFDKSEKPKPTKGLEYTFARRSGKSLTKDICHVWELGGDLVFKTLISAIVGKNQHHNLSVVLVLDLSRPEALWNVMEILLKEVKTLIYCSNEDEKLNNVHDKNLEDKQNNTSFPIPLIIVGSKYDVYQNLEPAKKRIICQSMRYVAHTNRASLLFYSTNDATLVKKAKEVMSHYGFGTSLSKTCVYDINKPLFILAGYDTFDAIDQLDSNKSLRSMQECKTFLNTYIKQVPLVTDSNKGSVLEVEDPLTNPNYMDSVIDEALKKKQEEHKLFMKDYEIICGKYKSNLQ
ncbi:cytoplasmic dynein 2 light intermediate chain 1 isoform X2 [Daktulosphaira vitifoliae]|nr:cytoplasmic dynein 2 light intermediate chain 1 isoform X2 [Daktulosphaira vitifoliae]